MIWRKLGMIFDVRRHNITWIKSHAMLPTPLLMEDVIRIFYTARDENGCSRITYADLDRKDPTRVVYAHDLPLLDLGRLGTFDDSGTLATCAIRSGKEIYLYYNGYNRRVTVPYSNSIGLAVSRDGGETFERMFEGPIVDRNAAEPYFTVGAYVMQEDEQWHMWYASATRWIIVENKPESVYVIKYARSKDGITWVRNNHTCIEPATPDEANVRGTVIKEDELYKMWFCFRGSVDFRDGADSYRIGYAESRDAIHWSRKDQDTGISFSSEGWDSKMQAYPSVLTVDGARYLFYNGNGFGQTGFGCAVWED